MLTRGEEKNMSKTIHFIGIKGSGMSALALLLHQMGYKVQGSDVDKYYFTQHGLRSPISLMIWKLLLEMLLEKIIILK